MNALIVLLCLASGALLPAQAAVNGKAAHFLNSPFRGGLVSFAGGFLILLILSFATNRPWPSLSSIGNSPSTFDAYSGDSAPHVRAASSTQRRVTSTSSNASVVCISARKLAACRPAVLSRSFTSQFTSMCARALASTTKPIMSSATVSGTISQAWGMS